MEDQISSALQAPSVPEKVQRFHTLIDSAFPSGDIQNCSLVISGILSSDIPILQARELVSHLASGISTLKNDAIIGVAPHFLQSLSSKGAAYDEEEVKVREELCAAYTAKLDFLQAARVLAAVNIESASRILSTDRKADILLKVAENFLEAGEDMNAEAFNSKAANFVDECSEVSYKLRNRVCHARILDNKGEFMQAARAYYALSQETGSGVMEGDLLNLLQFAITSCILAKAGPQRSLLLATIYKDERSQNLPNFDMLEKMFMQRIVLQSDAQKFSGLLQEYQKYKLASGLSVLENAILEHNILAISKVYNNIRFEELGSILEVPILQAELIIANMIEEGRIEASLDQRANVVEFMNEHEGLAAWEGQAELLCQSIEKLVEDIVKVLG